MSFLKSKLNIKQYIDQQSKSDAGELQQQLFNRYVIIAGSIIYLLYLWYSKELSQAAVNTAMAVSLITLFSLAVQTALWFKINTTILKVSSVFADAAIISSLLIILGYSGSIFFVFYLWQIVGYGIRFGVTYLKLMAITCLVSFCYVISTTAYWQNNIILSLGLILSLTIIPLYLAKLITRLNHALEHANEANMVKSQFLANMSHELRTPLTGIVASADMLKDEELEGEIRNKVNMISESANTLMSMIGDVLDVSKVESGRLELNVEEAELLTVLKNVKSLMAPQAQRKGLDYIVEMDPEMFQQAEFAPVELQQILINLVGNAIKFTQMGNITLRGTSEDLDGKPGWRFEVQDTGIGIDEASIETIFDPFVQADSGITRQFGGTGLGTAICKEFVNKMNGFIGVDSTLEQGSTFWFKIPVSYTQNEINTSPINTSRLFSVALIDEEKRKIKSVFSDTVITQLDFSKPEQAIQRLKNSEQPILLTGKDLSNHRCEQISATLTKHKLGNTPIIRMGQDKGLYRISFTNNQKSLELWTTTSTSTNTINQILSSYLHQPIASEKLKPLRPLNILVADDAKTNRDILSMMLEKQGHHVTLVNDGLEAMEQLSHSDANYELVILDRNMPGMDGINVLKTHRVSNTWRRNNTTKFLLITADATEETRLAAFEAGMDGFLTKPLIGKDISVEIQRLYPDLFVEEHRKVDGEQAIALAVDNTKTVSKIYIDYAVLDNLGDMAPDGNTFIERMVNSFLKDATAMLEELTQGFSEQDYGQTLEAAHALKGSSLQIGAPILAEFCNDLRLIARIDFTPAYCSELQQQLQEIYSCTIEEFNQYLADLVVSEDHSSSSTPQ